MFKPTIDMGYEIFEKREELTHTLAYALIDGLCKAADTSDLLCDFTFGKKNYSGADLLCTAAALSKHIKAANFGERAGITIPPSFIAVVANYACILAKVKPINLNFTLGPVAAKSCIETANITKIITTSLSTEKISLANPLFPWTPETFDVATVLEQIPQEEFDEARTKIAEGPDAFADWLGIEKYADTSKPSPEATLVFTSGSEGAPKAAILTERNIIANCLQTSLSKVFDLGKVLLANLPIFHSFGLLFEVWYMAIEQQKIVSLASPLDIKNNIRAVKEKEATYIIGSPTFFRAYIKHAKPEDLQSIQKAIAGAEKTPIGFHELWNSKFGDSYREGYGLTEASPVVGVNLPECDFGWFSTGSRKGSIGKLFVGMSAAVLDPTTLEVLPMGEQGLLAMRGANIFAGYLNNPDATENSLKNGWLITGDLARLDTDGFLYIDGRLSRFSKIGGEMVPHATVEAALNNALGLATKSDIPLIAISARLDEGKGEAIVLISACDITLAQAKEALRQAGISNLWHPKHLVHVDSIPLLPSGKLDLKKISEIAK